MDGRVSVATIGQNPDFPINILHEHIHSRFKIGRKHDAFRMLFVLFQILRNIHCQRHRSVPGRET